MATYNHHNKNDQSTESWHLIVLCLAFFTSNKCDQVMLIFRRWCCRCYMSALLLAIKSGRVPKIKICQPRCLSWNQSKTWFKSDLQRLQLCDFFGVTTIKIWCPIKELSRLAFCSLMPDEFMKNEPLLIHFSSGHNARSLLQTRISSTFQQTS